MCHKGPGDQWKSELREVSPEGQGHITEAQGTYTRHVAQVCFDSLFAPYDAGSDAGKGERLQPQLHLPLGLGLVGHSPAPALPVPDVHIFWLTTKI
jgi:hypothetical protein